jgi:hypothetical protein
MTSKQRTSKRTTGLIGLFGHTYVADDELPGRKRIQYQFEIIRSMLNSRWVVQLFSFADGRETELRVFDESYLLGEDVKLYADIDEWHYAYEMHNERRRDALRSTEKEQANGRA